MRLVLLALTLGLGSGCGGLGSGSSGGGNSGGSGGGGSLNADAHMMHNLDALNSYRAAAGVPALVLDDQISAFSMTASMELKRTNTAHQYFGDQAKSGAI